MLSGLRVALRPWASRDLAVLAPLRNDVALQQLLLSTPRPNPEHRVEAWVRARSEDPQGAFFVVAAAEGDGCLGFAQLTHLDPWNGTAELGLCLSGEHRGRGFGAEALGLVEGYAASVLGVRKLMLSVRADNARARRLYERAGYRVAGCWSAHFFAGGAFHDVELREKLLRPTG